MRHTGAPRAVLAVLAATLLAMTGCSAPEKGASSGRQEEPQNKPGPGNGSGADTGDDAQAPGGYTSTFAVDIDNASYTYARRQILDGRRPDPGSIRPEEFVNAFRQDFPQPSGNGFTVTADGAR